jgi:UPF0716 protein FxsA
MVKWIIVAVLLLPLAEIAVFVLVAVLFGLLWALALMLATTLAGALVLRYAGRSRLARFRVAVGDRDITGLEANSGGLIVVLAGLLLLLPGFITDLIGALLLVGPVRRWCGAMLGRAVGIRGGARDATVDLAPEEWRQIPDPTLEHDRTDSKP